MQKLRTELKFDHRNRCIQAMNQVLWLAGHHPRGTFFNLFPPGCELLLALHNFTHLSTVNHCNIMWYLWFFAKWGFYRSPIHGKPIGRECLKIALKIATRVRTQQCFLVLTPHFAVKRRGEQRPQILLLCVSIYTYAAWIWLNMYETTWHV